MSTAPSRAARAAMIALSALGSTGILAIAGQALADQPGRPGPATLRPPRDVTAVATFEVQNGAQVYACRGGAFVLTAPEATLVSGERRIHHSGGPSWRSEQDGSTVTAAKVVESPVTGSIPELLLRVGAHTGPAGELSGVTFIQRLRTSGGVAPAGTCREGAEQAVPYTADYVFFAPR